MRELKAKAVTKVNRFEIYLDLTSLRRCLALFCISPSVDEDILPLHQGISKLSVIAGTGVRSARSYIVRKART